MDEIAASKESQMIICSPEEAFTPADLQIFEKHIEEIVNQRKSAVISGTQPNESEIRLTTFLKELSTRENALIQLEHSFIFTDMDLLKPDSGFSLFGAYLTNGTSSHPIYIRSNLLTKVDPTAKDMAGSSSLPISVVDGSKIIEQMGERNDKPECAICLSEPAAGEKFSVLFCKHWFHRECVSSWFQTRMNCPLCKRNS